MKISTQAQNQSNNLEKQKEPDSCFSFSKFLAELKKQLNQIEEADHRVPTNEIYPK